MSIVCAVPDKYLAIALAKAKFPISRPTEKYGEFSITDCRRKQCIANFGPKIKSLNHCAICSEVMFPQDEGTSVFLDKETVSRCAITIRDNIVTEAEDQH